MSGGKFDYIGSQIMASCYDGIIYPDYDFKNNSEHKANRLVARELDPMHDKVVSELVYDVACLLKSLEWYESWDTSEEQYLEDLSYFKDKWLFTTPNEQFQQDLEDALRELKENMCRRYNLKYEEKI